jgi:hypothetical protein
MQPYNYQMNVVSPLESAVQGLKFGAGLADMQAARQANALKLQQEQQALAQQQAAQQAIAAYYAKPNKTLEDFQAVGAYLPADKMKAMTEQFKLGNEKANQDTLGFTQQALAAIKTGNVPIALDLIGQRVQSFKNSGRQDEAQALETWGKLIEVAPGKASDTIMAIVSGLPGGKDVIESITKLGTESRAQEMQPLAMRKAGAEATTAEVGAEFAKPKALAELETSKWNVKNLQNQINVRGAQLGLDRQRLAIDTQVKLAELGQKLTEIPAGAQKLINDAAVTAGATKQEAVKLNELASKVSTIGSSWGAFSSGTDWLKKQLGSQDAVAQIRQEYEKTKNALVIADLPPGTSTDTDIRITANGFPPANASPAYLASFLRGMAKQKEIISAVDNAKVDWLASNKGALTRAQSGFMAGDYAVKAGESFTDFQTKVAKDVAKRYTNQNSAAVDQIPTPRNPNPSAASGKIIQEADAIIRGGR